MRSEKPNIHHKKIQGLDTLRFAAFFSVFIGHATPYWSYGFIYSIHLFFVLSSFLLTYLVLNELKETGRISRINFLIRRGLRIYPLYFLVLAFSFIVLPIISNYSNWHFTLPPNKLTYIFFLSNFDHSDHIFPLKFLWSISIEEQFYLLFIGLSFFFKKHFYVSIGILLFFYLGFRIYSWRNQLDYFDTWMNPACYFIHYAAGMVAARLYFEKKVPSIKKLVWLTVSLLIISVLMDQNKTIQLFDAIPLSAFFASLILLIVQLFKYGSINNKIFNLTEYFGKYTYGLYVYSGFVIAFVVTALSIHSTLIRVLIELAILIPIALISYHLFEVKFLRLKTTFQFGKRKTEKNSVSMSLSKIA